MANSVPFRLNRNGLLLALVSAAFAGGAGAAGGRVDFATEGATISGTDGRPRPLTRGTELATGDTVRTDTGGRAQIRFPDGAYVSLQPNTEFSVKEYNFDGKADGTERSFFGLAKGAMRTVTGLIGRVNKNRYQVATPTATIGIRGTGGMISIGPDGSTLVIGTSGIWTLSNPSGTVDVPAGKSGKAPSAPNQPPQQTTEKPSTGPTQPTTTELPYTQAGNRTPTGTSADLAPAAPPPTVPPLASGNGYALSTAFGMFSGSSAVSGFEVTAVFNSANNLTDASAPDPLHITLEPGGTVVTGPANLPQVVPQAGNDGVIAWGRWIGPVSITMYVNACEGVCSSTENYSANQGLHYVIGTPTAVMPTTGTGTYVLLGATTPTYLNGSFAPGAVTSGQLNVTFGATTSIGANLSLAMSDGKGYALSGTTTTSSSQFEMSMSVAGSGGACCGSCSSFASGFFAGTNAERAGLAYHISDNSQTILGAAAFKKQ